MEQWLTVGVLEELVVGLAVVVLGVLVIECWCDLVYYEVLVRWKCDS